MKATGTNTESSTSVIATIAPVISPIAAAPPRPRHAGILLHHALDVFNDDDRVVDDDADRQDEREQRHGVEREAERENHREGTDQRDRNGDQRDQRRPQVAEEQEDDDDDEDEGLDQRVHDLVRSLASTNCRVS